MQETWVGKIPREGNGNPLQYSCLKNPMDRGAWVGHAPKSGKEFACNAGDAGDLGLIPELGRSPGGRNGNPLQYSCLDNPMDRGI